MKKIFLILSFLSFSVFAEKINWQRWEGTCMPINFGSGTINGLWHWGLSRFFNYKCEINYEISWTAWLNGKGKDGIYGAEITYPYKLKKGYIYKFEIAVLPPPNYVLVNNKKVWSLRDGYYKDRFVQFTYVPEKEENIKIYLVKEGKVYKTGMRFCYIGAKRNGKETGVYFLCLRSPYKGKIPSYEIVNLPDGTEFIGIDPHLAKSYLPEYGRKPVEYKKPPLKQVPYPTSEIVILDNNSLIKGQVKNNGINGLGLGSYLEEKVETLLPMLKGEGILHLCFFGPFFGRHLRNEEKFNLDVERLAKAVKRFLESVPDSDAYLWIPEADGTNFGKWDGGIHKSQIFLIDKYKDKNKGPLAKRYETVWNAQNKIYKRLKKKVGYPDRFHIIFQSCDALFELDCYYKAGADIVINKNIERQNINLVVANARGVARAYKKPYGFDHDCWCSRTWYNYHPKEVEENLRVYFQGGGKYFNNEIPTAYGSGVLKQSPTALGVAWLDFIRWARVHPKRGKQKVKIAFMRSLGKRSKESFFYPENKDYILFDLVFPEFYYDGTLRLATGTPYGPVDIIPYDTPFSHLKTYSLIIYLGSEGYCMEEEYYENLKNYVKNGGILIIPVGQLRKAIGTVKGDLHDIGKNLVVMMWKGAGFEVEDLGIDVPPEKFVEAAKRGAKVIGMSALLTTTMVAMKDVIEALKNAGVRDNVKIIIGGAPVTQSYADEIGADGYAPDAAGAVDKVKELLGV